MSKWNPFGEGKGGRGKKSEDGNKALLKGGAEEGIYETDTDAVWGEAGAVATAAEESGYMDVSTVGGVAAAEDGEATRTVSGASGVSAASSTEFSEPVLASTAEKDATRKAESPLGGITPEAQKKFLARKGYGKNDLSAAAGTGTTSGDSAGDYDTPILARDAAAGAVTPPAEDTYQDPELARPKPGGEAGQAKASPVKEDGERVYE